MPRHSRALMATAADAERTVMGYLSDYEHDIFVSYAHADSLNDWSKLGR